MITLAIGCYKKFPHYEVIGTATGFYIWIRLNLEPGWHRYEAGKQGASDWIVGADAFKKYNKLKELLNKGEKEKFIDMMVDIHSKHKGVRLILS